MSSVEIDDEELTADLWQVIETVKEKALDIAFHGMSKRHGHIASKKIRRMKGQDLTFILHRLRGYKFKLDPESSSQTHQLVWKPVSKRFKVVKI